MSWQIADEEGIDPVLEGPTASQGRDWRMSQKEGQMENLQTRLRAGLTWLAVNLKDWSFYSGEELVGAFGAEECCRCFIYAYGDA